MLIARWLTTLLVALLLASAAGCGGGQTSESTGPGAHDGDDDDDDDDDDDGNPAERLRDLVDDVVGLATDLPCAKFADELRAWTDEHAEEINDLVEDLARGQPGAVGELSAYVDEKVLLVTEAAANCGSDEAWEAWEHLESAVDEARE